MSILGIDPGTAILGWGIVEKLDKGFSPVAYDCIRTSPEEEMPVRLLRLRRGLRKVVREFEPGAIVVERLFFNTNAKTAISVGQARGVVMLVAAEYRLPFFEYTALEAKFALTGYGRSKKAQVQEEVARRLGLPGKIKSDDAADALAIAICHLLKNGTPGVKGSA